MKELFEKYLNKNVLINLNGLELEVKTVDIKMSYGKIRYQVAPVAGSGKIWVEELKQLTPKQ